MRLQKTRTNPYQVVLPIFEGPLDLLLHLIRENKLDIYDIPIENITDQYIAYLNVMESLDLDIAGEFMVMAATLLEIKSKMLLPPDPTTAEDEEVEDPRMVLVERLIQYQRFKEAAEIFHDFEAERQKVFSGAAREIEIDYAPFMLKDVKPEHLIEALRRILADVGEGEEEVTTIARQKISIRMRMSEVWRRISASADGVVFDELFEEPRQKAEIVVTFLAILELLRLQKIIVRQNQTFDNIEIFPNNAVPDGESTNG
ncbi:MAG: segregation/condensation protein A [Armatimonadota bacterium]